jgi:ribosomal protein L11 methyltransferase
MYLWRKAALSSWLDGRENLLQARLCGRLAVISRPGCKRLQLEIACASLRASRELVREFGGRAEKLPRDWLKRFAYHQSKQIKIGKRLLVSGKIDSRIVSTVKRPPLLIIPASAAFGTGEHCTTAMSLRLLEQITRGFNPGWSFVDLGTGSGILALAAKRFGAKHIVGIDVDPTAISIAKANARLNRIDNADFQKADVRWWKPAAAWDIIAANLYSDLLIEILPKLKRSNWLILSGVLRTQEKEFLRALRRTKIEVVQIKRRGKWIAVLAQSRTSW